MSGIRKLGVFLGVVAFVICISAGLVVLCPVIGLSTGVGLFFVGSACFFASLLIFVGSSATSKPSVRKPASVKSKAAPAKKTKTPAPKTGSAQKPEQANEVAIYAGNLSPDATEEDLRRAFEPFGKVTTVNVVIDKFTGKSKGFGFVEMPVKEEAANAIEALNGHEMAGRKMSVNVAKSMPRKTGSGPRRHPRQTAKS